MRHNKLALYVHCVWSTWDRLPLINQDVERRLWRAMHSEAEKQDCQVIAVGGIEDHVHMLLSFPATEKVCDILKAIKGSSSRFANAQLFGGTFKWQASYAALTVSRWDVDKVQNYVQRQREHHTQGTIKPQLEDLYRPDEEASD